MTWRRLNHSFGMFVSFYHTHTCNFLFTKLNIEVHINNVLCFNWVFETSTIEYSPVCVHVCVCVCVFVCVSA